MKTKAEALAIILEAAPASIETVALPLDRSLGRVLALDAHAETDLPPFEKSSMDGWAVRAQDVRKPGVRLEVKGRVHAGDPPPSPIGKGEAVKIMTGAPLPEGADAVVMVEQSEEVAALGSVTLNAAARVGQNVCHRGEDLRQGELVVRRGTWLDPIAIGLLAMIGLDPIRTFRAPTVAVIPTGDELIPAGALELRPGQIRESNGALLAAQVRQVSPAFEPILPGIARDHEDSLSQFLDVGLGHDVLILSGGVSMGDLDLVGKALKGRGLEVLVEKVSIKPGKPLLFGRVRDEEGHVCHVFGLPGNPVSSFVTFELFVRPFLIRALGVAEVAPDEVEATFRSSREISAIPRTQHVPAHLYHHQGGLVAEPLEWHGSADLRGLLRASGFIVIESGANPVQAGDRVRVHRLPSRRLGESPLPEEEAR